MSEQDWSAPTLHRSTVDEAPEPSADPGGGVPDSAVTDGAVAGDAVSGSAADAVHSALATGIQPALGADPVGVAAASGAAEGWSSTVVHSSGAAGSDDPWSSVTYAGARRYRPHGDRRPGGEPDRNADAEADVDVPDPAGPPAVAAVPGTALEPAVPPAVGADLPPAVAPAVAETNRGLLSSSRTMAIASLVSRITGLLRTVAIAAAIGSAAGSVLDPYNQANSLPNMVYELLVGGVLSSVLIPLIVYAQEHDHDRGVAYTQRLLSIATAALGVATLLAVLAAPLITDVVVGEASKRELTTIFATLLLPEIFFYGVGALLMAVLNSRGVFGPPAWAPVLNNVVVIVTLAVFAFLPGGTPTIAGITDLQILVLGIGTTLGIVVQAVVLLPSLRRSGFTWAWRFRASSPVENGRLREVRTLALWVLGYVAASQLGVVVIARVGSAQGDIGYSIFVFADLLFQVPYGILGVSLLTALMPRMSRAAANGDLTAVVDDLGLGARLSAVALVPITFGLFVLGPALTTSILLAKFQADKATLVGVVLAMSAFGLLPFAVVMLQMRVFYAMRDARTPTLINVAMVGTKVVLVLLAVLLFDSAVRVVEALAVATSLSYVVGAVVGHVLLQRRLGPLGFRAVGVTVLRVGVASAVGALVAGLVVAAMHALFDGPRIAAVSSLVLGAVLGGAVMVAVAWRMRVPELRDVVAAVRPSSSSASSSASSSSRNSAVPAVVGAPESRVQENEHE